jgi:hypothetical protein
MAARPLPDGCPSFGPRMPTSCLFRPCRSSRLRRFSPRVPCRSVAPCTRSWGSVRFRLLCCAPCGSTSNLSPPRDRASHPSELSPRPQPYRVTAALAFPSFERLTNETLRSQGLSPSPSPLPCPTLPSTTARCSPGLRSPPGSSPNSLQPIHRRDPKAPPLLLLSHTQA